MRSENYISILLVVSCFLGSCIENKSFDYVDPFIGTGGHGHTFPGATLPFGMVQLSPDTRLTGWDGCSGYHYSDSVIYGFSHTHLSGTGVSDYGDVLIMPYSGETIYNNGANGESGYSSIFSKSSEIAEPGYYTVLLEKDKIKAELTATERAGIHKYTFESSKDRKLIIDLAHRDEVLNSEIIQVNENEISGFRHSKAWAEKQFIFFDIQFNAPIKIIEIIHDSLGKKASLDFGKGTELLVKIGISAVDENGAMLNLKKEIPDWNFNKVRKNARNKWQSQLDKIKVNDDSEIKKEIFYTALYHTMIAPNIFHDVDGRYRGTDLKIHSDSTFSNYTVFSLWDTYRSTHPLYTIIERKRSLDFIKTFLKQYEYGGILPVWELAGNYTGCMIGYHSVSVIADAYNKGIRDFDSELALEAMLHSSKQNRLGIDHFHKNGFISSEQEPESVSKTLEYAYDDWCIARMAQEMGKEKIVEDYYTRAQYYKNVFDPSSGFMRARNNNRWFYPFDPTEVNYNYTEANSWQYSFYVPQDVNSWMELLGGDNELEKKLDGLFNANSETKGRHQSDITGLIGQYAHGNEPSHHIPYLYNFVGRPDKTQNMVRKIMDELYSAKPDGLSGNEDCGQMSSWLVMSALGFYPLTPGSTDYIIGSPWFKDVTIQLENGKVFSIEAPNNSDENKFVENIELKNETYPFTYIKHSDIMKGGKIHFEMVSKASQFGRQKSHRPVSEIEFEILSIPALESGEHAFFDSTKVKLNNADKTADIYYSFSNDDSVGIKYDKPFYISDSRKLYVWSEKNALKSGLASSDFYKIPEKRNISLKNQYANHYTAGGANALIDFIRGGKDFRTGAWQGYHGVDLEAIIDLGRNKAIKNVKIGFLQDENAWIFFPTKVEFFISSDGEKFESFGIVPSDISYKQTGSLIQDYRINKNFNGRYVKVIARNRGVCPPDHKGAGEKAWIFADEIIIN